LPPSWSFFFVKKELWPTLAVANGMDVNGIPEKNQLVKLVK
jgi:hypothetical protein